jgi:hypothetical protein
MTAKLITENNLVKDHFLSATEEEGEYIQQPTPGVANSGQFRLLSDGTIADFSFSGEATSNGSTTTIIHSGLSIFGDDFFIGAYVTVTEPGHGAEGEQQVVSDFAQATGTLTVSSAFSASVDSSDAFTLTLYFSTREFIVELISSGDAGDATFRWSHDGGITYFGRNDPDQANWLAETEISSDTNECQPFLVEADDGALLALLNDAAGGDIVCRRSTDNGITWGSEIAVGALNTHAAIKTKTGRIYVGASAGGGMSYSDDNGLTWSQFAFSAGYYDAMVELPNGRLFGIRTKVGIIYGYFSDDGGITWTDYSSNDITICDDGGTVLGHGLVVAGDGSLICVYHTDTESAGDYEIKARKSTDNGMTWSSTAIDVADFGGTDLYYPAIEKDINGDLYCVFYEMTADNRIVYVKSDDNGDSWGSQTVLKSVGSVDLKYPFLKLINGRELVCIYWDSTNNDVDIVRRGMWELYSANACTCAPGATVQSLVCGVGIVWHGGSGNDGDSWSFKPEYDFAMSNIIDGSPSKPWRSENDGIACSIVIDVGEFNVLPLDSVAFFGCNMSSLSFQMNSSNSWSSPSLDQTVTFTLSASIDIDGLNGNVVLSTGVAASLDVKDHELAGKWFRATSGTDSGEKWKIKDNVGDYIYLDTTLDHNLAVDDTFAIDSDRAFVSFTRQLYRFIRIAISAQSTAEGYYQIGQAIIGSSLNLAKSWRVGYKKKNISGVARIVTPLGGSFPVKKVDSRKEFKLSWSASEDESSEIITLTNYIEGKNLALVMDSNEANDCYCVFLDGDIEEQHRYQNMFDFSIILKENI